MGSDTKNRFKLFQPSLVVFLAIIFFLALGACSTTKTQEPGGEPIGVESTQVTIGEEKPQTGGVLRVAMQPLVNIDPIAISSDTEVLVANHVYDYLVDVDPRSNPVPRLAMDWKISDDGKVYVFELANNVTWHDGTDFTSDDVVWTFDRLRNTDGTPTADLYANIESIEATEKLEVTFTLKESNPFFLFDLSDNHALVLKSGTEDADQKFNGTGPFKVTNYIPEDRIEMVKNEAYFVPGEPLLDGLDVIFFNDETAGVEALRGGQIDLVMRMSTSLFESLKSVPGIITVDVPTNGFDLVRLRSDRPPGNDPKVIQALKLATDRQAIWQIVQQGYGAVGNDTPIGPLYEAYHDPGAIPPARDVQAAKNLLAEAGYDDANPLQLTLHTPDTGGRPDLATVISEQWAEAGVMVDISVEPESVYYGNDGWLDVDLGITGWGSRPYPQFYLDVMLVSGAKWNEAHFADPEFDALAQIAGTTLNEQERIEAYRKIQEILIARGPVIIPYYFAQFGAISDQFVGVNLKAFAGRTDFRMVNFIGNQ